MQARRGSWLYWIGGGILAIAVIVGIFLVGRSTASTSGDPVATAQVIVAQTLTAQPPSPTPETIVITTTPYPAQITTTPAAPATNAPAPVTCDLTVNVVAETPIIDIEENMDTGDQEAWVVTFARDETGSRFVAVINPGKNLDFESTLINGKYWLVVGTKEDVACFAKNKASEVGGEVYLMYVGDDAAPDEFSKDFAPGWKMKVNEPFTEVKVSAEGEWSDPFMRELSDEDPIGETDNWTIGQMWDGSNSSIVYHFLTGPNYQLTFTHMQGTWWWTTVQELERFQQMTREVLERDDPVVIEVFCGEEAPAGDWDALPSGWICQRIP